MDYLQAGIQFPFASFPESSKLSRYAKERSKIHRLGMTVKLASFGDRYACAQLLLSAFRRCFARVAAVYQHAPDVLRVAGVAVERGQ